MRNKRILYIATIDVTIYAFLIPHIEALWRRGYEVEVACHSGQFAVQIRRAGIHLHHISFERRILSPRNLSAVFQLTKLLRRERYDLIYVHTPVAAFLGRLTAKLVGAKTLYTAHGFHFIKGGNRLKNLLFLSLERLASLWTDALIAVNDEDYEAAKRYKLAPAGRLYFVKGVGVDVDKFNPNILTPEERETLKQELKCNSDKIIGMIGEFNTNKRQIDLLDAAKEVLKENKGVTFLFVGDGPLLPKLKRSVDSRWEDKIKFLGWREDIPRLLNIIDILVLPSLREGLSRSIQEAMASCKPVIATDVRGNRDLVTHRETGLLVPPKDPETLAQAILRLLQNEGLAERMGKKAREVAVSELSLDKIVEQTVVIQEELLNKVGKMR